MYIYKNAVDFVVMHKMTNNTKLNLKRFEKKKPIHGGINLVTN